MVEQFRMPEPPFVIQERHDIPHMDVVRASDYAALEARCHEQRETLNGYLRDKTRDIAAYQARIAELEAALRWIKGECLFACGRTDGFDLRKNLGEISHRVSLAINGSEPETACEHHWMPATQAGSLAIIGRGCSKCGAWETSPEPNYRFQEPSNLPSQSMTIGAHPVGGPCIHVWALTNRDAVENGRCGICGQSVANRGVK